MLRTLSLVAVFTLSVASETMLLGRSFSCSASMVSDISARVLAISPWISRVRRSESASRSVRLVDEVAGVDSFARVGVVRAADRDGSPA
jgi:hypothetical protein